MFDIDRLFEEWPSTLGLSGFPLTEMRGMSRPPQTPAASAASSD